MLLRVTAYVLRFVARLKGQHPDTVDGTLAADDIHQAEMRWIQDAQHTAEANPKFDSWHKQSAETPMRSGVAADSYRTLILLTTRLIRCCLTRITSLLDLLW